MKKQVIAAAALALVSGVAAAGNATVYGFIDAGVYTTNNGSTGGQSVTSATNGLWFPSMIGITGSEDLGGGMKANFNLQGSLWNQSGAVGDANKTSSGTNLFGRYATVGLSGGFGSVNLGRQIDNMFLQSFVNGVIATHTNSLAVNGLLYYGRTNDNQATAGAFFNNAVEYATPTFQGLQAKVQYVIGGAAGSTGKNSAYNIVATYDGPVKLSAGYENSKDTSIAGFPTATSTVNGVTTTKTLLGAKYSIGPVDLAAQYNGFKSEGPTVTNSAQVNAYEVGAAYHLSSAALVGVNFESFNQSGAKAMTVTSLKAKYDFSKRTYAYGLVSYMNSEAAGKLFQGYATALGSSDKSATGFGVGLVHAF